MPAPIWSARAEADNRPQSPDKAPTQQNPTPAEDDHTLPARVVVQLPDGDILLGEDSGRLRHEHIPQPSQPLAPRVGAQPGSEQWLELRRLLYATGLEAIVLTRKRATSIILGVDLVYMFMAVASIALRGIDTSGHKFFDSRVILSLNVFGAILDCITIGMVVKQHQKAIRVLAIMHALLIIVIGPVSFIAIAIIRVLLISFLFRLLAALVELQWVVSAQPLSAMPRPAWVQSALLGVNLSSLRGEYFSALQQMARQSSREAEGGGAEIGMHTVQLSMHHRSPRRPPSPASSNPRPAAVSPADAQEPVGTLADTPAAGEVPSTGGGAGTGADAADGVGAPRQGAGGAGGDVGETGGGADAAGVEGAGGGGVTAPAAARSGDV